MVGRKEPKNIYSKSLEYFIFRTGIEKYIFWDQGAKTQTLTRTFAEQRPVKHIHEAQDSEWQCIHESKQYVAIF